MIIPSKSNPVIPEMSCKECKEVQELKHCSYHGSHYDETLGNLYPLNSCKTEWISSEIDHTAHMIRFHPEKVFDVEVQSTINEALLKMWRITRSKEVARLEKLSEGSKMLEPEKYGMICQVCHGSKPRCRNLNWHFSWPARTKELRRSDRVVSDRKSGSFLLAYTRERQ